MGHGNAGCLKVSLNWREELSWNTDTPQAVSQMLRFQLSWHSLSTDLCFEWNWTLGDGQKQQLSKRMKLHEDGDGGSERYNWTGPLEIMFTLPLFCR